MTSTLDPRLAAALDGPTVDLAPLRERLLAAAEREGLVDVAYREVDSPFGLLLLAATADGVVRIAFAGEGHDDVLAGLAHDVSPRVLAAPGRLDPVARQLDEYFAGRRRRFDVPVDLRLVRGFRRNVLEHLRTIDYGRTESYAQAAAGAGRPSAVRAAASACSHNPVPIVVPCHRIVRSDGRPGHYGGGADMKVALLRMETS